MNWTDHAWESITAIYSDILTMPFIIQLSDGSLPLDKFQFYMQQDAFYLEEFGRVLAFIGAKSADNQQALDYFDFGRNALLVERSLHENYFREFGLTPDDNSNKIEPTCHHYVHFLKSVAAFESVEVAMAATLPCFWIYKEVGDYIVATANTRGNPYSKWIETYSGDDFAQGVIKAKNYVDKIAAETTATNREKMRQVFITASQLEYQFWLAAYEQRIW
ncbi:MAG: thiaminase II [Sphingobacterium sp.]|jgi:thiaminase/transcriptional activator TenA|uniref:thiaminase II n=1 Tax=Sphingobacterium sp. TaxID=341027 RepID=UPI00281A7B9D|nr:thiaminase II [Sphingobacterium sp.]MDR0263762.1 thiaminase II [Sphingobacterium sp.]